MRLFVFLGTGIALGQSFAAEKTKPADDWAMNATIIEACSCPMFCQCYFNTQPATHGPGCGGEGEGRFCKFNNAFRVNTGHYDKVNLDGAKFWVAGDRGGDCSGGEMNWYLLVFDPAVTKQQRKGIVEIVGNLYRAKWKEAGISEKDYPMEWHATKDLAVAKLDGGKAGEVVLRRFPGMTEEPIVIKNLKYWGAPRNDGFVLMPNDVQAFRAVPEGKKPYEFRKTNGFMFTFDISSKDVAEVAATTTY
jgi:hypothetical protein